MAVLLNVLQQHVINSLSLCNSFPACPDYGQLAIGIGRWYVLVKRVLVLVDITSCLSCRLMGSMQFENVNSFCNQHGDTLCAAAIAGLPATYDEMMSPALEKSSAPCLDEARSVNMNESALLFAECAPLQLHCVWPGLTFASTLQASTAALQPFHGMQSRRNLDDSKAMYCAAVETSLQPS